MEISLVSIVATCVFYSVILFLMCMLIKRIRIIRNVGPECLIFIICFIITLMFFPVEFRFAYNIEIEDTLQPVIRMFRHPIYHNILLMHVLAVIWLAGALVALVRYVMRYKSLFRYLSVRDTENYDTVLKKYGLDSRHYDGIEKIHFVYAGQVDSPCTAGIKKPYILLPEKEYSREQMHYILLHEIMHIKNKDLLWIILIEVLCISFWWNPLLYYIKIQLLQLIEIRIDNNIVKNMQKQEVRAYMNALINTAGQKKDETAGIIAFNNSGYKFLKKRLELIGDGLSVSHIQQGILITVIIILVMCKVCFNIMPYSTETVEGGVMTTEENTYLIKSGNEYKVYIYGEYMDTVDDLLGYDDIPIYNSLEEAKRNE